MSWMREKKREKKEKTKKSMYHRLYTLLHSILDFQCCQFISFDTPPWSIFSTCKIYLRGVSMATIYTHGRRLYDVKLCISCVSSFPFSCYLSLISFSFPYLVFFVSHNSSSRPQC
uniref:Uncharacterized protein n=1 Tax=Cacopsylla melanoneura TaxID=428564 RepID=A0A8D8LBK7_9HEMI